MGSCSRLSITSRRRSHQIQPHVHWPSVQNDLFFYQFLVGWIQADPGFSFLLSIDWAWIWFPWPDKPSQLIQSLPGLGLALVPEIATPLEPLMVINQENEAPSIDRDSSFLHTITLLVGDGWWQLQCQMAKGDQKRWRLQVELRGGEKMQGKQYCGPQEGGEVTTEERNRCEREVVADQMWSSHFIIANQGYAKNIGNLVWEKHGIDQMSVGEYNLIVTSWRYRCQ